MYELVQKEHVWKALRWVNTISEENKKGLRVIKAIIEVRGMKKFKASETGSSVFNSHKDKLAEATSIGNLDTEEARKFFR